VAMGRRHSINDYGIIRAICEPARAKAWNARLYLRRIVLHG
jgi:hypothetical protein